MLLFRRSCEFIAGRCSYQSSAARIELAILASDVELDRDLRKRHLSLRAFVREIPPVFASI